MNNDGDSGINVILMVGFLIDKGARWLLAAVFGLATSTQVAGVLQFSVSVLSLVSVAMAIRYWNLKYKNEIDLKEQREKGNDQTIG